MSQHWITVTTAAVAFLLKSKCRMQLPPSISALSLRGARHAFSMILLRDCLIFSFSFCPHIEMRRSISKSKIPVLICYYHHGISLLTARMMKAGFTAAAKYLSAFYRRPSSVMPSRLLLRAISRYCHFDYLCLGNYQAPSILIFYRFYEILVIEYRYWCKHSLYLLIIDRRSIGLTALYGDMKLLVV